MNNYILEPNWGGEFTSTSAEAKKKALELQKNNQWVEFEFNGIKCVVSKETNLDNLLKYYNDAFLMGWKEIGPFCLDSYSYEMEKEIQDRKDARKIEQEEQLKKWKKEEDEKKLALINKISGLKIELKNEALWLNHKKINNDGYGAAIMSYAEQWALLMQKSISEGQSLANIADKTSSEADVEGITGFMYGAAVSELSACWKYGEELRVWHNGKYNVTGSGVVNPAILTIGKAE